MSESNPDPQGNDPGGNPPTKIAGKFDDIEAFAGGVNAARQKVGLDPLGDDAKLFGDDDSAIFRSQAAAETYYNDLERLITKQSQQPKPDPKKGDDPPLQIPKGDDPPEGNVFERAGVEYDDLFASFRENEGKLDDATYAKLEQHGMTRDIVDGHFQLAQYADQLSREHFIHEGTMMLAGETLQQQLGEARGNLEAIIKDARSFVPADEIDDLNARLSDSKSFKGALRQLIQMHNDHVKGGGDPIIKGSKPQTTAEPAKDIKEHNQLVKQAARGDQHARARLRAGRESGKSAEYLRG